MSKARTASPGARLVREGAATSGARQATTLSSEERLPWGRRPEEGGGRSAQRGEASLLTWISTVTCRRSGRLLRLRGAGGQCLTVRRRSSAGRDQFEQRAFMVFDVVGCRAGVIPQRASSPWPRSWYGVSRGVCPLLLFLFFRHGGVSFLTSTVFLVVRRWAFVSLFCVRLGLKDGRGATFEW